MTIRGQQLNEGYDDERHDLIIREKEKWENRLVFNLSKMTVITLLGMKSNASWGKEALDKLSKPLIWKPMKMSPSK